MMKRDDLILDQGECSITAAEAKGSDLKKTEKKLQVIMRVSSFSDTRSAGSQVQYKIK